MSNDKEPLLVTASERAFIEELRNPQPLTASVLHCEPLEPLRRCHGTNRRHFVEEVVVRAFGSGADISTPSYLVSKAYECFDAIEQEEAKRRAEPGPISTGDAELDAQLHAMGEVALHMGRAAAAQLDQVISNAIKTWLEKQNENHQDTEGPKRP